MYDGLPANITECASDAASDDVGKRLTPITPVERDFRHEGIGEQITHNRQQKDNKGNGNAVHTPASGHGHSIGEPAWSEI